MGILFIFYLSLDLIFVYQERLSVEVKFPLGILQILEQWFE
ncbi:hypothetical protein Asd1617_05671 [Shigella dysenteriae 1617]|uniref:Uncharacterized protein n=1 Tax=Shigella dysenteriae 1617 TaxID=754093 RepID=A0A0A7A2A1_SHIDY|nr:hypothetical protein Asd1617_05671 [Shigella dysenteriae 1617]